MSPVDDADFGASAAALTGLTEAAENHPDPPVEHIHAVADHPKTHSWFEKVISEKVLRDVENRWKLGTRCVTSVLFLS
jgi:hypothetical protein